MKLQFKANIKTIMMAFAMVSIVAVAAMSTTGVAQSKALNTSLTMQSIKMFRSQETSGDELYLTVTSYPTTGRPTHQEIPRFPQHWQTKHLDKVSDVVLWKGKLEEAESTTVVVSLIDRDVPPWNIDDLIGTIQVLVQNKGGHLIVTWKVPNRVDIPVLIQKRHSLTKSFDMLGAKNEHYRVSFEVNH